MDIISYALSKKGMQQSVSDYLDEHLTNPTNPPLDTSLTIANAAADSKATGDKLSELKEDLSEINEVLESSESVDFTSASYRNGLISTSNKWNVSSGFESYYFAFASKTYKSVEVTASQTQNAVVGILASSSLSTGATPTYATGYSERISIPAGETATLSIPDDCIYITITKQANNIDYTPTDAKLITLKDIPVKDDTLTVSGAYPDSKIVGDEIRDINSLLYDSKPVDVSGSNYHLLLSGSTGKWRETINANGALVPLVGCKELTVTANDTNSAVIALLTTSNHAHESTPDYATGTGRISILVGTTQKISVPSDARYIYCLKSYNGSSHIPSSIDGLYPKTIGETVIPLGLHEMPDTENALNIVKRCRQLTDIKWTPAVDLARLMYVKTSNPPDTADAEYYLGTFKAGIEYKGVPYGRTNLTMQSCGYNSATIGAYIDFDTFISSVSNPKSRLSLSNVGSTASHISVIYAAVCSGLASYALDLGREVYTENFPNISGLSLIGKVNNNGALLSDDMFKIGDVLNWSSHHVAVITDIIRDGEGLIKLIEISECTCSGLADKNYADGQIGGLARRKGWTRWNLFYERWKNYSLYRYSGTVTYTPSQYVNVGDEFDGYVVEHFPIMPYEGEGFAYKTGYIPNNAVKLVYTLSDYAYVKVFKDDVEISGSPFALTEGADSIDITEITAGEYTAYLCNITDGDVVNCSYPCHWNIT